MGWMILFFLLAGVETAAAQENRAATVLEQRYDRESNPRKQSGIALDLTKNRLEQLRSAYDTGDSEQQKAAVEACLGALDRLGTAVTAAGNVRTSKNVEVFLRRYGRDLENLKTNVSYFERPEIEKIIKKTAELREQVLYSIMNPDED